MKSAVEALNPTRVRLTVEVPFEELRPNLDSAYKRIASQVSIPGFRKGKVPPRLIDQRFGRGMVLEEAVNEALPRFYGQALEDNDVQVVGSPQVDVTEVPDPSAGGELRFTAEVDVRPDIEVPDYSGLEVVVEAAAVSEEDIGEQLENLRERFATLRGVERPVQDGDFVSIDLAASVDGAPLEDATAKGLSYQVGSGSLLPGLDDALPGLGAGESRTFPTQLVGGEHAGATADVTVTVGSVKERELPELDDEFAQTASEFDTLEELRADLRTRLERMKQLQQGVEARDKTLEALLAKVDVPLPESVVQTELESRRHSLEHELQAAGMSKEQYLQGEGQTEEAFDAEVEARAREAIKAQLVLDAIATREDLRVEQSELTEHLIRRASQAGIRPDEFAQQVVQGGHVPVLVGEVLRGKALALVLEAARVTDPEGNVVDLEALREDDADGTDAGTDAGTAAATDAGPTASGEGGPGDDAGIDDEILGDEEALDDEDGDEEALDEEARADGAGDGTAGRSAVERSSA